MARGEVPARGVDQFPLRLPDGMRDAIKVTAKLEGISMNEAIVQVLQKRFFEKSKTLDSIENLKNFLEDYLRGKIFIDPATLIEDVKNFTVAIENSLLEDSRRETIKKEQQNVSSKAPLDRE